MSDYELDLEDVVASDGFTVIPAGTYQLSVEKVEWKTPKEEGKDYLNLQLKVVGEKYNGSIIFHMFHLFHANEQPRNIARGQYKAVIEHMGRSDRSLKTKDEIAAAVLYGQLNAKVKIKKSEGYEDKNVISSFAAFSEPNNGPEVKAEDIPF